MTHLSIHAIYYASITLTYPEGGPIRIEQMSRLRHDICHDRLRGAMAPGQVCTPYLMVMRSHCMGKKAV